MTGGTITHEYTFGGEKIKKIGDGETRHYIGGVEYNGTALDLIHIPNGRIVGAGSYQYQLADHLGNTVVVFEDKNDDGTIQIEEEGGDEVIQRNHYYSFGMRVDVPTLVDNSNPEQKYLYNGIEKTKDFGLDWEIATFRSYDAAIGRWTQVDPLTELRPDLTPYRFGFNSPVMFSDPLGLFETKRQARRARRRARRQGHTVGELYKSGDEWGFTTGEGEGTVHNFTKDYKAETFTERAPDPLGVNYGTGILGDWRTWTRNGGNWEITRDYHSNRSANVATTIGTAVTPLKTPGWLSSLFRWGKPRLNLGPGAAVRGSIGRAETLGKHASSYYLGRNMIAFGRFRNPNTAAHHIVAGTDPRASIARGILARNGVDINAGVNGVFLPRSSRFASPPTITHSNIHTDLYYRTVDNRLLNSGNVRQELMMIRQEILNGTFPY